MIMNKCYPLYFHPSRVVLVDDNESFLVNTLLKLPKHYLYKTYSNPLDILSVLDYWNDEIIRNSPTVKPLKLEGNNDPAKSLKEVHINIDLQRIHERVYNKNRFYLTSIAIIDYIMPQANGIVLSEKISEKTDIRKILLTGHADYEIAVSGFNKSTLNKYIQKDQASMFVKLASELDTEALSFFRKLTSSWLTSLADTTDSCISESFYLEKFQFCLLASKAVEYYILDMYGSCAFLNYSGEISYLFIFPSRLIKFYMDVAAEYENTQQVIDMLRKGCIPFLYKQEDYQEAPTSWLDKMVITNKLDEKAQFLYAYCSPEENPIKLIDQTRITSFEKIAQEHYR